MATEGQTATRTETGERIVFQGGQWVPFDDRPRIPGDEPSLSGRDLDRPRPPDFVPRPDTGPVPETTALGRIGGAFAEPFKETEFGIPEPAQQFFQGENSAINTFNDLVIRGVASPAFSVIQGLGATAFGTIDALAQAAVEVGVDQTTADIAARDIKGALEAVGGGAGVLSAATKVAPIATQARVATAPARTAVQTSARAVTGPARAAIQETTPVQIIARQASNFAAARKAKKAVPDIEARAFRTLRKELAKDLGSKGKAEAALRKWVNEGADPDTLADLGGGNFKRLIRRTADVSPDKALRAVTRFIQEQPEQIRGQIKKTISKKVGVAAEEIDQIQVIKRTQGAAKYKAIEDTLVPVEAYNAGVRPLLQTIDGKRAVRKARRRAELNQDSEMVDTLNLVLKGEEPTLNIRAIQLIKKEGFDDIIGRETRAGGQVGGLKDAKNRMLKVIDDAVPDYKAAREFYAGEFEAEEAIKLGRQFMTNKTAPEIASELASMGPSQKEFYRVGVADAIDNFIAGKLDTADKARLIRNERMRRKIRALTEGDSDAADEFIDFLQTSSDQFERRRFISPDTGSQTAGRGVGFLESGAIDLATGGGATQTVRTAGRALAAATRTKRQKALYEELAEAFFVGKPIRNPADIVPR